MNTPNEMLTAYIECALWSSTGIVSEEDLTSDVFQDSDLEVGDDYPLDDFFGAGDLSEACLAQMDEDCAGFLAYCEETGTTHEEWSHEQLGHDFWLTRNGHGAGFWDSGLPEGNKLTEAAKTFGSCDLYLGDDGLIYCQ